MRFLFPMPLYTIPLIVAKIPPQGYHIHVEGKIQRKQVRFLLDTGASKSVIDYNFATTHFPHNRQTHTDHQTTGLGAQIPNASFMRLRGIHFDGYKIHPITFALLDLSTVNQAYAEAKLHPIVAIIGGDIMRKYQMVIDYATSTLSFRVK